MRIWAEIWIKREDEIDISPKTLLQAARIVSAKNTCITEVGGGYCTGFGDYGQGQKRSEGMTLFRYGE